MTTKKQLEFEAKLSTQSFEEGARKVKKVMEDLQKSSKTPGVPGMTGDTAGGQAFNDSIQKKNQTDQLNFLREKQRLQEKLLKDSQKELDLKKQAMELERQILQSQARSRQFGTGLPVGQGNTPLAPQQAQQPGYFRAGWGGIGGSYPPGGGPPPPSAPSFGAGFGRIGVQGAASVLGGIVGVSEYARNLAGYPIRAQQTSASAIQATTGKDLSDVYSGASPLTIAPYLKERSKAAKLAEEKESTERIADRVKSITGAALIGLGIGAGATGVGLPLAAGLVAGGGALLSNDATRLSLGGGKEYERLSAARRAQNQAATLQAEIDQDPQKKLTLENYQKNMMRDLNAQRTLGLGDQGFYRGGGLLARGAQAGFTADQTIGMGQNIVGAGGSARMGAQSPFGLQMERAGYTNAAQILGMTSGGVQGVEQNKRAIVGIMSEAFKVGLDNSDYVEENRRFTAAAAEIIGRTGATTGTDQDRISRTLGQFLGERTNQGVEAAKNAYERFQERGSDVGGRRGAMRLSLAMQDKNKEGKGLSNIPQQELSEFLATRPEDLMSNDPGVMYLAKKAGISPQELINKHSEINRKSRFFDPKKAAAVEQDSKVIQEYIKNEGITRAQFEEKLTAGQVPENVAMAAGEMGLKISEEEGTKYSARRARAARGEFLSGAEGAGGQAPSLDEIGGKLSDLMLKEAAQSADEARKSFNQLAIELSQIAGLTGQATQAIVGQAKTAGAGKKSESVPNNDPFSSDLINKMVPNYGQPKSSGMRPDE